MGKIKVTRKALKRDEVKEFGEHVYDYCKKNGVTLLTLAGIVFFLSIAYMTWGWYRGKRLEDSGAMLSRAMGLYQQGLVADEASQRDQLFGQAIETCETLRNRYAGSPAGRQSLLVKANAQFAMDRADAAILQYQEYRDTASDKQEKALAEIALGYCYENEFFRSKLADVPKAKAALEAYDRAQKLVGEAYPARQALMGEARLEEVIGKYDPRGLEKAIKTYEKVIELAKAEKAKDKARFAVGKEEDQKKKSQRDLLPPVPEVFDASAIAQTQIDRLKVLMAAGEAAAAAERSVPPATAPASGAATRPATNPALATARPVSARTIVIPAGGAAAPRAR